MDLNIILSQGRSALSEVNTQMAALLTSVPDFELPVPGSRWTIAETAVHILNDASIHAGVAVGTPSPRTATDKAGVAVDNDRFIKETSERDRGRLVGLIGDAIDRLLAATAAQPAYKEVLWALGVPLTLAHLVCLELSEMVLHGYDIAAAAGLPWPISPLQAELILFSYGPLYHTVVNHERVADLTIGVGIELRDGPASVVRFVDGQFRMDATDSGPVDCQISVEARAFLMVVSGRLSQWAAIALGLMSASGDHPELALGFRDLFLYP
jgi:hypothetical protein